MGALKSFDDDDDDDDDDDEKLLKFDYFLHKWCYGYKA